MKSTRVHSVILFLSAITCLPGAAQQANVFSSELPTYVRKFQSDRDVSRPSRLQTFALQVSGPPASEDRITAKSEQWDVDPTKYPGEFVIDSPHVVKSTGSLPKLPALAAFGQAMAEPFTSHDLVMGSPSAVTTDSDNRIIIADPLARAIHVYDLEANRYFRLQGGEGRRLQIPSGVAVDSGHNIYVTDLSLGMILVYDRNGRFQRYIGQRSNQEGGLFYRPSSIAIDQERGRIFVSDTPRHMVVVLDLDGKVLTHLGRPDLLSMRLRLRDGGIHESGTLRFPTDLVIRDKKLYVLGQSMVQVFDADGQFLKEFAVETTYSVVSGLAVDSQGRVYVSDGLRGMVSSYDKDGTFLYRFGGPGSRHGEFSYPRGLWVDEQNRIYVADSINGRVQVFQLHAGRASTASNVDHLGPAM